MLSRYNHYVRTDFLIAVDPVDGPDTSYQINTLSEIFVSWNDIVASAEEEIARLEREQSKGEDVS